MIKKKQRARLSLKENTSVRFDPNLRYLLELMARSQRRSVSCCLAWMIDREIKDSYADLEELWDVDEEIRFNKLVSKRPDLLTYEEQIRWMEIQKDLKNDK